MLNNIPLYNYKKIKNNFGISYYGNDVNVIYNIINTKPLIESKLPELQIYIICNDEYESLFVDKQYFIKKSDIINCNKCVVYNEIKNLLDLNQLLKGLENEI